MTPRCPRLLHESLRFAAERHPDKTAVIADDERIDYGTLHERASRLACGLQARGVRRGDRVAILLENSVATVVAIYGTLLAGAAFVVVHPQTKADKLAYLLHDAEAAALIAEGNLARVVADATLATPALRTLLLHGKMRVPVPNALPLGAFLNDHPPEPADSGVLPIDLAALVYTSGSTGRPKGVMLSHQNMVFTQGCLVEYLRLSSEDRILNVLPLAFDYGLYQAIMAVHLGATLVLEASFSFPARVIQRVRDEGVTVFPGVPTMFATLVSMHRETPLSLSSIRRFTNTAAHLPDDHVPVLQTMSPGALVFKMYGLTECKRVAYLEPELVLARPSSVGRAIPGTEAFVLDDDLQPVPPGRAGTLWVRGPHVMMGYWKLPDATDHMLKPGRYPGERMLCTHDLFRTDDDGFLYFLGRTDDIIKSRGEKVAPVEVENALATIPGVKEVAVVGLPDELLGEAVCAFVVLDRGHTMDARAFRRAAMARLENYQVPRDVVFLDSLPKTDSGKVRKKSLLQLPPEPTPALQPGVA